MKIFAIRDIKVEGFNTPFFQTNTAVGLRLYENLRQDPQSMVSKNPEDFQLFELGEWDSKTGQIGLYEQPKLIM